MRTNNVNIMFCLMLGFLVVGCTDRVGLANQKMQEIRSQPAQPIAPPPQPQAVQAFPYSANQFRSPFMPPSLTLRASQEANIQSVKPDMYRLKEPLEQFELNQLIYRGMFVGPSGELSAIVQTPEGQMATIKVGNYMGKNHGRVVAVETTHISLIEIVPDSRVGYIEQPTQIALTAS